MSGSLIKPGNAIHAALQKIVIKQKQNMIFMQSLILSFVIIFFFIIIPFLRRRNQIIKSTFSITALASSTAM